MARGIRRGPAIAVAGDGSNIGPGSPASSDSDVSGGDGIAAVGGPGIGEPIIIDPSTLGEPSGDAEGDSPGEPKRRGRKPGSRNAARKSAASPAVNVAGLERLLFGVHQGLAKMLATPELGLEPVEAKMFAESYAGMAQHYPALAMSAKVTDTLSFVGIAAMIYGPRLMAIRSRRGGVRGNVSPAPPVPEAPSNPAPRANGATPAPAAHSMVDIPGLGIINRPPSLGGLN